ncbi:Hpt domain-containing protein [Anaerolinea thermophila]|jgi:HPt (histidine-containing phosphotransfer) domain-containing protein|uniref:Hpt domain-containing protein n=2 Tax=Anaerolinea TaxID=233189 RepID=UPI0026EDDAF3|nr:Hpt domain-containing protein [Anaerolinea thermophila]
MINPAPLEKLRKFFGTEGDSFVREVIVRYLQGAEGMLNDLERYCQQQDISQFIRVAHTLKGNSASVGADEVSQLAADLEIMGRNGDLSGAPEKIPLLRKAFVTAKAELEQILQQDAS